MVMSYIPARGDLVWLNFSPQVGYEQRGKRPAIVISPKVYNQKTGLALCCPISSHKKGYPFEVQVSAKKINGVILADHLKNLDWKARKIKFIERVSSKVIRECIEKILVLLN